MRKNYLSFTPGFGNFTYHTYDYGIIVDGSETRRKPVPDVEAVEVPGRSGDLLFSRDRYANVDITYHCAVKRDFDAQFQAFVAGILKSPGYGRLTDWWMSRMYTGTYNGVSIPGVHRHARVSEVVSPSRVIAGAYGEFDLTFNCKPQMWLNCGATAVSSATSFYLTNPTPYPARPTLTLENGALAPGQSSSTNATYRVGGNYITVAHNCPGDIVTCDSELQDCYYGTNNLNKYVSMTGGWPVLGEGSTLCQAYSGRAGTIRVVPNWWTL